MILLHSLKCDLFNLKYTTNVKDNRKEIIAHTAVSSGLSIPLGIIFEKKRTLQVTVFKQCLTFLFGENGIVNLRNVSLHSVRGYMIPSLVFGFLLSAGAEVVGTLKRMAGCWPFTYNQKLKESNRRTSIDEKRGQVYFWNGAKLFEMALEK